MIPAVIVPAFSRPLSLKRLLSSINNAVYPANNIELIISLDGGYSSDVLDIAENFQFSHGNKKIIKRKNNIGLREHILWCGDQTEEYGAVIILEDDLIVGNQYYNYAKQALEFYQNDDNISGISLYGHKYNEYANLPFEPYYNGYSGYFMQIASSWGQAWSQNKWLGFKQWYKKNNKAEVVNNIIELPDMLKNWPESSWKKYYSAYLVKKNRYFLYPYFSFTTNCTESGGTHAKKNYNLHQVPISNFENVSKFIFPDFNYNSVKYDSFFEFESINVKNSVIKNSQRLCVDIYGIKPYRLLKIYDYVITSRCVKNHVRRYSLRYKPVEMNFLIENNSESDSDSLFLSKTDDVIVNSNQYIKIAKYYTYLPIHSYTFLFKYGIMIFKKIFRRNR